MRKKSKTREELVKMYIDSLEEGKIPWEKMWSTSIPENAISGEEYKGVNNLILSYVAQKRGYKDNRWCTFYQLSKKGWKLSSKAKGQSVNIEFWKAYCISEKKLYNFSEYYNIIEKEPERKNDFVPFVNNFQVFNADLIEGISPQEKVKKTIITNEYIDSLIQNLNVKYKEEGNEAYYNIEEDEIVLPISSDFKNEYAYYSTQLHEIAHSTGHPTRLNREMSSKFGTKEYAKEELRAEISSSFLMQKLNLEYDDKHYLNHKSYIQSWIEILNDKPTELFNAISDAKKITDYIDLNSKEKNILNDIENDYDKEIEI